MDSQKADSPKTAHSQKSADDWIDVLVDRLLRKEEFDVERFLEERRDLGDEFARTARRLVDVLGRTRERADKDPEEGRVLGDYRVIRLLGRGGMGSVYVAEQRSLSRLVALKLLRMELAASPRARERLSREAMAIAKLRHPNIVTVHDAGEIDGVAYLAMELLTGCGLDERIRGEGGLPRLSVAEAVRAIRDVARALQAAHQGGVLHRDVKPSNIRITPEGSAVLLDFGLAEASDWKSLSESGVFRGTPHYAPPEQVDSEFGPVDARSDVYSLGATLYECATGRAPFVGDSTRRIFHQILTKEPPPPRRLQPGISRDLETVIGKAMARERAERYATAGELADDLDALLEMRPVRARPLHPIARLARFVRRRPAVGVAALLALLLLVVVPWIFAVTQRNALAQILRLSDMVQVRELEQRAGDLWPRRREKIASMEAWLHEARELLRRAGAHRADLERLGETAPSESAPNQLRWRIESLTELVARLDTLATRVTEIESRLAVARSIDHDTVETKRAQWTEAASDVARDEAFGGLVLHPQPGLVPLGPDPESGLWEFFLPETGEAPERGEDGRWHVVDGTAIVLVLVPGGSTRIGAQNARPDEPHYDPLATIVEPLVDTELDPFFLSKYEMTQGQWQRIASSNPSAIQPSANYVAGAIDAARPLAHPVEQVDLATCREMLARLGLELPTDAQWEHAARGGTSMVWWFGDDEEPLREVANLMDQASQRPGSAMEFGAFEAWNDGYAFTSPVGHFLPNPFGLHDVYGNTWEWCREGFFFPATLRPGDGERSPAGNAAPTKAGIVRGGCYSSTSETTRSSARWDVPLEFAAPLIGVRPMRRCERGD